MNATEQHRPRDPRIGQTKIYELTNAGARVREAREQHAGASAALGIGARLAHPSLSFPVVLNAKWRAVDHRGQWVLQQRKGNPRDKNSGWEPRFFFRTRSGLLNLTHEYCGEVDPQARATLEAFPEWHP